MPRAKKNYRKTNYTEEDLEQLAFAIALGKYRDDDGNVVKMTASEIKARTSTLLELHKIEVFKRTGVDGSTDVTVNIELDF